VPVEEPPQRSDGKAVTASGKLCLQFYECHVSGLLEDPDNEIALGLDALRAAIASQGSRLRRPSLTRSLTPADGTRDPDTEAFRRLTPRHSISDGGNHTFTKVEREGLCHRNWPPSASLDIESARDRFGNLEGSVRSRGEIATPLTVRDLIEAGLNKPAGSQALWG
jgi:hypothetical protein